MRRLVPFAAVFAVTLAACGDDGMSAKEYRAAAKKVCVDAEKATDAVEQPTRSTPEAIVDYLERLLDANERTIQRFEKLDPPDDLQKPHDDILDANRDGARTVRGVIRQLESGEDAREVLQSSTSRLRELGERSNEAAERLGVRECVQ
jgi:hypothetical protein